MRIRITRDGATGMVAITALPDEGDRPPTVRVVDPEVADAVEALMASLPFGGATGLNPRTDLDAVLDQAEAAVREERLRRDRA